MQVTINGEVRGFDTPLTVAALLARLDIEPRKVAIERNLEIVPKSTFADVVLADGDRIEIVQFVGGG
ncbi:MAG: sulfur carrier protein ThiS [Parvularculaceae bacterium]|nr:sulfur carrier protein ThiS [Parvularculaceae bacterium]